MLNFKLMTCQPAGVEYMQKYSQGWDPVVYFIFLVYFLVYFAINFSHVCS